MNERGTSVRISDDPDGSRVRESNRRPSLKWMFSRESIRERSSSALTQTSYNDPPDYSHGVAGSDFIFKLVQIVIGIICAGMYSEGLNLIKHSVTTLMFPNIVFSSFLIITGVSAIGAALGHRVPDLTHRAFCMLGSILYAISASVSFHTWYNLVRYMSGEEKEDVQIALYVGQAILSFVNAFVYAADVWWSYRLASRREARFFNI